MTYETVILERKGAVGLITLTGEGRGHAPLLFSAVPVFAVCFWLLRKRFQTARQARITRLRSLR